jgi:hypothetical protein
MPDYHDIFWKLLFQRIDCAIEFFRFLLKEKSKLLELENLGIIQEIIYRKKKLLYDILYEIPIRNSNEKLYFLLEHKSRSSSDFQIQMMKYKQVIHKWQKKQFGRMYSIIPVLFYQGLEIWDPEKELYDWIRGLLGHTGERIVRHGVLGALNLDVSSSLSIGAGAPRNFFELFGIAGGLTKDYLDAKHFLEVGMPGRAAEKFSRDAGHYRARGGRG